MPKVLIVDDSPMVQRIGKQILEKDGYEVIFANNGKEGVEKSKKEKPDIILMDAEMPEMDGWEALSSMKADAGTKDIPVVICSGSEEDEGTDKVKSLGGQGYLTKPYNIEVLKSKVKEMISK